MAIEWRKRHTSDPGLLAFEGAYIRGQVAVYDEVIRPAQPTGRKFFIGYVTGAAGAATARCASLEEACWQVEQALAMPAS